MNPILREALKTTDGKMAPGLMSAVNDKRDEINKRLAAVKGMEPNMDAYTEGTLMAEMRLRVEQGLDPLTGDADETVGMIRRVGGKCVDETGREVTLDDRGNWVYA